MSINQLRNRWGVEIDASEDLKTIQQHLLSDQLVVVRNSTFANYTKFSDFVHNIGYMLGECCGRSVDETGVNTSPIVQVANPNQNDVPSGGFSYMGKGSGYWHQDGGDEHAGLHYYTALYAHNVPPVGGDTMFTNLKLAWNDLSNTYKNLLRNLNCVSISRPLRMWTQQAMQDCGPEFNLLMSKKEIVKCPLVAIDTLGEETLMFSPRSVFRFEGMYEEESTPILDFLTNHCTRPEYTFRHQWQPNDLILWLNQTHLHYGVYDYTHTDRRLWQVKFQLTEQDLKIL